MQNDKPHIWNIHQEENMERAMEVDFHKFAIDVAEMKGLTIENINVFTFYASYESLLDKNKSSKNG